MSNSSYYMMLNSLATAPIPFANLQVWLDGSNASTMNGGTAIPTDPINRWADLSGNGFDATQLLFPGSQPIWDGTGLYGGGGDYMTLGDKISKMGARSVYCVFQPDALPSIQYPFGETDSLGTEDEMGLTVVIINGTRYQSNIGDGILFRRSRGSSIPTINKTLYNDRFDFLSGPLVTMEINGIAETVTDGGGTATTISGFKNDFSLFRPGEFNGTYFTGTILEFIAYNTFLPALEHGIITNYLKVKHGL